MNLIDRALAVLRKPPTFRPVTYTTRHRKNGDSIYAVELWRKEKTRPAFMDVVKPNEHVIAMALLADAANRGDALEYDFNFAREHDVLAPGFKITRSQILQWIAKQKRPSNVIEMRERRRASCR